MMFNLTEWQETRIIQTTLISNSCHYYDQHAVLLHRRLHTHVRTPAMQLLICVCVWEEPFGPEVWQISLTYLAPCFACTLTDWTSTQLQYCRPGGEIAMQKSRLTEPVQYESRLTEPVQYGIYFAQQQCSNGCLYWSCSKNINIGGFYDRSLPYLLVSHDNPYIIINCQIAILSGYTIYDQIY